MMELSQAYTIAEEVLNQLAPHCIRIAIAGSIRRKCPFVKDIELCLIPKPYETGLFSSGIAPVLDQYPIIKGHLPCKYTQRRHPAGINMDIFFARPENWGLIFAIRTGSAKFSHEYLARTWVKKGFKSIDGMLTKNGRPIALQEEKQLFELIGLEYIKPEKRL